MQYNLEVLSQHNSVVPCFVQHLAYARGIRAARDPLTEPEGFWATTASAHLAQATIDWCKVFGTESEQGHWTSGSTGTEMSGRDFIGKRPLRRLIDFAASELKSYQKGCRKQQG